MSCGVGHRRGLSSTLLWLWCRLGAVALIRPPSLGTSKCHGCGPKKTKNKKKNKTKRLCRIVEFDHCYITEVILRLYDVVQRTQALDSEAIFQSCPYH